MKALISQILPQVVDVLSALLVAMVAAAFARLGSCLKAHTKNAKVAGVLDRLNDATENAVLALEQTMVMAAKAAAGGGKMPAEIAARVKQAAIEEVKTHLGDKGIAELKQILGVHPLDLDSFLATRIEATVMDTSDAAPTVPASEAPTKPISVPPSDKPAA